MRWNAVRWDEIKWDKIAFQSHKVTPIILVSIVSSYGLVSDGTKQLTSTNHAEFLQCNFSENVLYHQGILQIGRFIFQDFYRIPGDNELVASVNGLVQILNQKYQHFNNRDRGGLQTVMSVLHVKEKKMKIPTHLWYKSYLLTEVSFGLRVLSLSASVCPSVCQSRACLHDNLWPF